MRTERPPKLVGTNAARASALPAADSRRTSVAGGLLFLDINGELPLTDMEIVRTLFAQASLAVLLAGTVRAQPYVFTTIAGSAGQTGTNDGIGAAARFHWPEFLTTDPIGNVYISDTGNHAIRMLSHMETGWKVSTIASNPPISTPKGILFDDKGNILVADYGGAIFKLTPNGTNWLVSTVSSAASPWGLARDGAGNLYYSDYINKVIRRLSPDGTNWISEILVGTPGTFGGDDGTNGDARFAAPQGLAVDTVSNLYLGEGWAYTVRKISPVDTNWVVTTVAGTTRAFGGADGTNGDAKFAGPAAVVLDSAGALLVADPFNQAIRKVSPMDTNWVVTTLGGQLGFDNSGTSDGVSDEARFKQPAGVAMDRFGNIYVADTQNSTIRLGTPLKLSIDRLLPHQVVVSWTILATGFVLEASSTLPASTWTTISNSITPVGNKYFLTNNAGNAPSFYRLRKS